eukprot:3282007-Karenia_brevis.AAC.1
MWTEAHLQSKFLWAGHVMRMNQNRLARRATVWRDSQWWLEELKHPSHLRVTRQHRTHWFRWEEELKRFAAHKGWTSWQDIAQARDETGQASAWIGAAS